MSVDLQTNNNKLFNMKKIFFFIKLIFQDEMRMKIFSSFPFLRPPHKLQLKRKIQIKQNLLSPNEEKLLK